jgi:hypothetical protein
VVLGFHTKQLCERGTEVALFDYAHAAQSLLGHEVRVFVPAGSPTILPEVRRRFEDHFELVLYRSELDIACDALYVIKRGKRSSVTQRVPELNHAFHDVHEPHGHRFAAVSERLARSSQHRLSLGHGRTLRLPRLRKPAVVPHIVQTPSVTDDLRHALGIPADSVVFGRHGGADAFDLEFVKTAIGAALELRPDIWFAFLNTDPFLEHERVVNVPRSSEREDIQRFVNTCDYMLHAHAIGETFGLAVAEFAVAGVPVLTYLGSPQLAHLDLLSPASMLGYRSSGDVLRYLTTLPRRELPVPSTVAEQYSKSSVMSRFAAAFLA